MKIFLTAAILGCFSFTAMGQTLSPLFARGYTVLPEPQRMTLGADDFAVNNAWQMKLETGVAANGVAAETLREDLAQRFHLTLASSGKSSGVIALRIAPGSVEIGKAQDPDRKELEQQAYRIDLKPGSVTVTANADMGLFYGVETLVQLLRPAQGTLWLPEGTITDWPDLQLRQIYWDDNHHLEKMDALKHALRQAAFYKINGFVIKLNGHFRYKSAPAVVEPYALTPEDLQELTDYGLRYHVQLIPYLDGPAHIAFILKHPEYAKLREYPDSNYELCATNPESYKLLEGMYQDLMDANKGVKYFYISTDEAYYLGLADNAQCNEAALAKKLGSVGQVFAHFMDKTGGYLHDHGRQVMFWGEYPLKPSDIPALPPYLINGETYGPTFDKAFHARGIRQMIYTSSEGEEKFFPDYAILPWSARLHQSETTDEFEDSQKVSRVVDVTKGISTSSGRANTTIIGEVNAGWADEGVNPETFWLGYAASAAAGWHPSSPDVHELASSFYTLFYGPRAVTMDGVYQRMSYQAQSWNDLWEPMDSTARKPIWGSSYAIFNPRHPAHDQTLPLPPAPGDDLSYSPGWSKENTRRILLAEEAVRSNDTLLAMLDENLQRSQFNRYNLEVYVSIAKLCREGFEMIEKIHEMDEALTSASELGGKDPANAVADADRALDLATSIWQNRNQAYNDAVATWEVTWFPRVEEAHGRHFLHELDDVKDHLPDRTTGMSYLIYREKLLPFGKWVDSVAEARNKFAVAHHLPERTYHLAWEDLHSTAACPVDSDSSNADHSANCGTGN
jgi:hypothetical protein